jgi:hypothetical protein
MSLTDHLSGGDKLRFGRLPQWAQNLVRKLALSIDAAESTNKALRAEMAAMRGTGDDSTTTWIEPHTADRQALGRYPDLVHRLVDGTELHLSLGDDAAHVSINGGGPTMLAVQPVVSNEIKVVCVDRRP